MLLLVRIAVAATILLFLPGQLEQFESPKAAILRTLGIGLLAASLVMVRVKDRAGRRPWRFVDAAVLAWLAMEVVTTCVSVAPRISLLGDFSQHEGLLTSVGLAGLYGGARLGTRKLEDVVGTLRLTLAVVAVSCAYALVQVAGLDPSTWQGTSIYASGYVRPFGTLAHANILGVASATAIIAGLSLTLGRSPGKGWVVVALLLCGAATLLTLSRAAWMGAAAGVLVWGLLARPEVRVPRRTFMVLASAAGVALLVSVLLGPALKARLSESSAPASGSTRSRLEVWKTALHVWQSRPWLGSGPDTFGLLFQRYQTPAYWRYEWGVWHFHAHSIYLHTLATRGVLGTAAAAVTLVGAGIALHRGWRRGGSARRLAAAFAGMLTTIGVAGAFGALGIGGASLAAVCLGTAVALPEVNGPPGAQMAAGMRRRAVAIGVVAALPVLAWSVVEFLASHQAFIARETRPQSAVEAANGVSIAAADRTVRLDPWSDDMESLRTESYLTTARFAPDPAALLARAEASARRSMALAPLRPIGYQNLGNVFFMRARAGDPTGLARADSAYRICLRYAPYNSLAMLQLAYETNQLGHPQAALPYAQRATALYPNEALGRYVLATIDLALGDSAAARQQLKRALAGVWRQGYVSQEDAEQMLTTLDHPAPRAEGPSRSPAQRQDQLP